MNYKSIMIADGAPKALFLTPEARAKAWRGVTVRVPVFAETRVTRNEDAATQAFRAAEDERKRQKSLAQIGKMKTRLAAKAAPIDYSKVRWDPRRSKFVPDTGYKPVNQSAPSVSLRKIAVYEPGAGVPISKTDLAGGPVHEQRVTKDNAEAIAKLNGVWKPEYEKLRGTGRIVMTIKNLLRGVTKRGGNVKWL